MVDVDGSCPSQLAWSESWWPLSAQSAFINNRVNSRNDFGYDDVAIIIIIIIMPTSTKPQAGKLG